MTTKTRVLVVEDDMDALTLLRTFLARVDTLECTFVADPREAIRLLAEPRWDVLVTDLQMPGVDGFGLAAAAREADPTLPVLLMTAHPTLEVAVLAVKGAVTDFLTKPLDRAAVLHAIEVASEARRAGRRRVLAVGAHPDDIEIGAGATLGRHAAQGDLVTFLTVSAGNVGGDAGLRREESAEAAYRLGVELVLGDLEDTRIPQNGPTIDLVESVVADVRPDIVYVHSVHDVHQDHRAVHGATLVAAREVPRVLCYQSPSASIDFRPSSFVSIDDHLSAKLAAIAAFESQTAIRDYLDFDVITSTARYWGRFAHTAYAEPFEVIRDAVEVRRALA